MFDETISIPGLGQLQVTEQDSTPKEITSAGTTQRIKLPAWAVNRIQPQLQQLEQEINTLNTHKTKAMADVEKFNPEFRAEALAKALVPQRKVVEDLVNALETEAEKRLKFAKDAESAWFLQKPEEDGTEAVLNEMRRREARDHLRSLSEDERFRLLAENPGKLLPICENDPLGNLIDPQLLARTRERFNRDNSPEWLGIVKKQADELATTYGFVARSARIYLNQI